MADEEAQQQAPLQERGGLPLPLIIGVGAAVLLAAFWFFFLRAKPAEDEEGDQASAKKEAAELIFEKLDPLIINPKDAGFRKFLTLKIDLVVANDQVLEAIETKPLYKTRIADALVELLSDKTVEDLEGPSAKDNLKKEILHRLNALLGPTILKGKEAITEPIKDFYYVAYRIQ